MRIVGILLAAGKGARFGGEKLLATLACDDGDTLAGTAVGVAACRHLVAALPDSIAVVRAGDAALARALAAEGARVIECARADEGMGASLACGVGAARDADGCVVALADMPWIRPATILAVAAALSAGAEIAAPVHSGRRGHPVGFLRRHFAALAALRGDEGARAIVEAHSDALCAIDVDDPAVLRDVDRPADLRVQGS
ncbi:MAG: nucleotidyltransferase family protein [Betaproteobacteria bacterium]